MSFVEEGTEDELSTIEFRQLHAEFSLRIPEEDVVKMKGMPGPALLASSTRHGLLFFPLAFGFGWAKLSSMADCTGMLDYCKFDLDEEAVSIIAIGGQNDRWLLVGSGKKLLLFDLASFVSDPVAYEPKFIVGGGKVRQVVFGIRSLALVDESIVEIDLENCCKFDSDLKGKLLACDAKSGRIILADLDNNIKIINGGLQAEKTLERPEELAGSEIVSMFMVSASDVILGFEPKDKSKPYIDLFHVDLSSSDGAWTKFFDPTRPRKKAASTLFFTKLSGWDENLEEFVVVANACAADIGALGRTKKSGPIISFFLTTEEFLPQLPTSVKDSRSDQYPVGLAFDFTNPELTMSQPNSPAFPASPIIWILTNEGFFCPYRVIKNDCFVQYHGMNLNVTEFPNILKKRPTRKVPQSAPEAKLDAQVKAKSETITPLPMSPEPLKLDSVSSGFIISDFGKYTNALIQEFLQIQNMVETDFGQLKASLSFNSETINQFRKENNKQIKHIEKESLKLAQDCDNPAFLELYKIEKNLHELAIQIRTYQCHSKSLINYSMQYDSYNTMLQKYHDSYGDSLEKMIGKLSLLEQAKSANKDEQHLTIDDIKVNIEAYKKDVKELEQNFSLLKLANSRNQPTSPAKTAKPTKDRLAKFAQKFIKRSPSDCLNVFTEQPKEIKKAEPVTTQPIDPRFYQCIFPIYNEDEFASEPEKVEEVQPVLEGIQSPECQPDEFEYESEKEESETEAEAVRESEWETDLEEGERVHDVRECEWETEQAENERVHETTAAEPHDLKPSFSSELVLDGTPKPKDLPSLALTERGVSPDIPNESEMLAAPENEVEDQVPVAPQETVPAIKDDESGSSTFEKETVLEPSEQDARPVEPTPVFGNVEEGENQSEEPLATVKDSKKLNEKVIEPAKEIPVTDPVPEASQVGIKEPEALEEAAPLEAIAVVSEQKMEEAKPKETLPQTTTFERAFSSSFEVLSESVREISDFEEVKPSGPQEQLPTDSDMSMEDNTEQSRPNSGFGFLSLGDGSRPAPQQSSASIFRVPSPLSAAAQAPSASQHSTQAGIFKPSTFSGFAPSQGESIFPMFGQTTSSVGSSQPAFGSSQPASSFGQTSSFVQAPTFGSSSFGQSSSSSQPAFGSSSFGQSSTFGNAAAPTFGSSTTPSFGSAPEFGSSLAPAFGQSGFGNAAAQQGFFAFGSGSKVFGQSAGATGFGALASNVQSSEGTPFGDPNQQQQQQQQQQPPKKNLPTSFTQFRGQTTVTVTVTSTSTSTVITTQWYRAGLVLINSMSIGGTDAYAKDFTVDNVAQVSFANSVLNVFALPTTATCAYLATVSI